MKYLKKFNESNSYDFPNAEEAVKKIDYFISQMSDYEYDLVRIDPTEFSLKKSKHISYFYRVYPNDLPQAVPEHIKKDVPARISLNIFSNIEYRDKLKSLYEELQFLPHALKMEDLYAKMYYHEGKSEEKLTNSEIYPNDFIEIIIYDSERELELAEERSRFLIRKILKEELTVKKGDRLMLTEGIDDFIRKYIQKTEYNILGSWGNCAFYTKDFIENMGGKIIYMPLANPNQEDPEDHIVPVVNNVIVDFAYVPGKGVSKHDRGGKVPKFNPGFGNYNWPRLTKVSDQIFEKDGTYGKLGYLKGSKYADWEYDEYPELKEGRYPIYLNGLPPYATIEEPNKKKVG